VGFSFFKNNFIDVKRLKFNVPCDSVAGSWLPLPTPGGMPV
jgi:hypothetical protein